MAGLRSPRVTLAIVLAAGLGVAAAGVASGSSGSSGRAADGSLSTGKRIVGARVQGKLLAKAPRLAPADRKIGEEEPRTPRPPAVALPRVTRPSIPDTTDLTRARHNAAPLTPLRGKSLPTLPQIGKQGGRIIKPGLVKPAGGVTESRATQSAARPASSTDFTFFRNQDVPTGDNGSIKGEPSVGNDRSAILFTGNKYAAVSVDDGISFSWIDPKSFDDANGDGDDEDAGEQTDGGYCCDQLVNASDENGKELVSWLLQYFAGSSKNTIRLVTYLGKDDLATNDYCRYDFTPSDFDLASKRWLDYSSMQNSNDWLYITTNIFDFGSDGTPGNKDDVNHGSVVYRVKLSDLTDGNCTLDDGFQFQVDEDRFAAALTQNAGSTMYLGSHPTAGSVNVESISDSSTSISSKTTSVTSFPTGDGGCETPDGNNPCENLDTRIVSAWVAGSTVGFAWSAPQGGGYDFPQARFAIFKTSNLKLDDEHILWNSSFAWAWPAIGVNSRGDLGGLVYRIGGGQYPGARAFIVDDVESWSSFAVHSVISSSYGPADDEWGDYGTVARFDGCSETWQAGAFALTGGHEHYGDTSVRYAWFGRERDGCPDLIVERLAHLFDSSQGIIWIADTTRNIGSGGAAASATRFYLSKDSEKSSDDIEIAESHAVGSLGASDSDALLTEATLPAEASPRTYYLIACADAADVVEEITNTNNCAVDGDTLTVKLTIVGTVTARPTFTRAATTTGPTLTRPTFTRPAATTTRPTLTRPAFTRPTVTRPIPQRPKPQRPGGQAPGGNGG